MKITIGKFLLENVDVQTIEVPKGATFLSAVSQIDQVGIVTSQGQKAARVVMSLFASFDPSVKENEKFEVYIVGLNVENDIPPTAKLVGPCPVMGGQFVFHIYVNRYVE